MTSPLPPWVTPDGEGVRVTLDTAVYGMDAVLRAAHRRTAECFVEIKPGAATEVTCRFNPKRQDQEVLSIAVQFSNDVLDEVLRGKLRAATEPVRRLILAQAFSEANLLHPELDAADPDQDPAHIAVPDRPHP